jgi:hypothetical protein
VANVAINAVRLEEKNTGMVRMAHESPRFLSSKSLKGSR